MCERIKLAVQALLRGLGNGRRVGIVAAIAMGLGAPAFAQTATTVSAKLNFNPMIVAGVADQTAEVEVSRTPVGAGGSVSFTAVSTANAMERTNLDGSVSLTSVSSETNFRVATVTFPAALAVGTYNIEAVFTPDETASYSSSTVRVTVGTGSTLAVVTATNSTAVTVSVAPNVSTTAIMRGAPVSIQGTRTPAGVAGSVSFMIRMASGRSRALSGSISFLAGDSVTTVQSGDVVFPADFYTASHGGGSTEVVPGVPLGDYAVQAIFTPSTDGYSASPVVNVATVSGGTTDAVFTIIQETETTVSSHLGANVPATIAAGGTAQFFVSRTPQNVAGDVSFTAVSMTNPVNRMALTATSAEGIRRSYSVNTAADYTVTFPETLASGMHTIEVVFVPESGSVFNNSPAATVATSATDDSDAVITITGGTTPVATTTSLTFSPNSAAAGGASRALAIVTPTTYSSGVISFAVFDSSNAPAFNIDDLNIPTAGNGNHARSFTIPAGTAAGSYRVRATFTPTGNTHSASSGTATLTVTGGGTPIVTTTRFSSPLASAAPGGTSRAFLNVTPATYSSGVVSFAVTDSSNAPAFNIGDLNILTAGSGNHAFTFTIPAGTAAGNYTVTATFTPTGNTHSTSSGTATLTVTGGGTPTVTTTSLTVNPASVAVGDMSRVFVTVTPTTHPGGAVSFAVTDSNGATAFNIGDANIFANGSTTTTVIIPAGTAAGSYTIRATFTPTGTTHSISSGTVTLTVTGGGTTPVATTTSLTVDPASVAVGGMSRVFVTVTPTTHPGGAVSFAVTDSNGATAFNIGDANIFANGNINQIFTIPAGTAAGSYTIRATFTPTGATHSISSGTVTLTVTGGGTTPVATTTSLTLSPNIAAAGDTSQAFVTITPTTHPGGVISFAVTDSGNVPAFNIGNLEFTANSIVDFAQMFTVPAGTAVGSYTVSATFTPAGISHSGSLSTATLTVTGGTPPPARRTTTVSSAFFSNTAPTTLTVGDNTNIFIGRTPPEAAGSITFTAINTVTSTRIELLGANNIFRAGFTGSIPATVSFPATVFDGMYTVEAVFVPDDTSTYSASDALTVLRSPTDNSAGVLTVSGGSGLTPTATAVSRIHIPDGSDSVTLSALGGAITIAATRTPGGTAGSISLIAINRSNSQRVVLGLIGDFVFRGPDSMDALNNFDGVFPPQTPPGDYTIEAVFTPDDRTNFIISPTETVKTGFGSTMDAVISVVAASGPDTMPPAWQSSAPIVPTVRALQGTTSAFVSWNLPSVIDDSGVAPTIVCTSAGTSATSITASGGRFPIGAYTVTCTATDGAGNLASPPLRPFAVTVIAAGATSTETLLSLGFASVVDAGATVAGTVTVTPIGASGSVSVLVNDSEVTTASITAGTTTADFILTAPLTSGDHLVTARFISSDSNTYANSITAVIRTLVVTGGTPTPTVTTTVLSLSSTSVQPGSTVSGTVTVSPIGASGTASVLVNGNTITRMIAADSTEAGFTFSAPALAGTYAVTASFASSDSTAFADSVTSSPITLTVAVPTGIPTVLTAYLFGASTSVDAGGSVTLAMLRSPLGAGGTTSFTAVDTGNPARRVLLTVSGNTVFAADLIPANGLVPTLTFPPGFASGSYYVEIAFTPTTPGYAASIARVKTASGSPTDAIITVTGGTGVATTTMLSLASASVDAGAVVTGTVTVTPAIASGAVSVLVNGVAVTLASNTIAAGTTALPISFVAPAAAGSYPVTASFSGSTTAYAGSVTAAVTILTVTAGTTGPTATATGVSLTPASARGGSTVLAVITVTPPEATGRVQFSVSGSAFDFPETVTVSAGGSTFGTSFSIPLGLAAGIYTISATFTPDDQTAYASSTNNAALTVTQSNVSTSVSLAFPGRVTVGDEMISLQTSVVPSVPGSLRFELRRPGAISGDPILLSASSLAYPGQGVLASSLALPAAISSGQWSVTTRFTPSDAIAYRAGVGETLLSVGTRQVTLALVFGPTSTMVPVVVPAVGVSFTVTPVVTVAGAMADAPAPSGMIDVTGIQNGRVVVEASVPSSGTAAQRAVSLSATSFTSGDLTLTATFRPDNTAQYAGVTVSRVVTPTTNAATQPVQLEITQSSDGVVGQPLNVMIRATSGGAPVSGAGRMVTVSDGGVSLIGAARDLPLDASGTASLSLTPTSAGVFTIEAVFDRICTLPDATDASICLSGYSSARASRNITVRATAEIRRSTIVLTSSPSFPSAGRSVTLTAQVSAAGEGAIAGVVSFSLNGASLANVPIAEGRAETTLTPSQVIAGTHDVEAIFVPTSAAVLSHASARLSLIVGAAPADGLRTPVISLVIADAVGVVGSLVQARVYVTTPLGDAASGSIAFSSMLFMSPQTVVLDTNGFASFRFTSSGAGMFPVSALFTPDGTSLSSGSAESMATFISERIRLSVALASDPGGSVEIGTAVTLRATVTPADDVSGISVRFDVQRDGIAYGSALENVDRTGTDGVYELALNALPLGVYTVSAEAGDIGGRYWPGTSGLVTLTVTEVGFVPVAVCGPFDWIDDGDGFTRTYIRVTGHGGATAVSATLENTSKLVSGDAKRALSSPTSYGLDLSAPMSLLSAWKLEELYGRFGRGDLSLEFTGVSPGSLDCDRLSRSSAVQALTGFGNRGGGRDYGDGDR